MGQWDAWIGRDTIQSDLIGSALVQRWLATFDRPYDAGDNLPQGFHFCLCTPEAASADLGEDGHPLRSDGPAATLPPVPLPRRMWAGSDITFLAPLKQAQQIKRHSTTHAISEKTGASGTLAFVELEHVWLADGAEAIRETQTLVYRDAASPDAPLSPAESGGGEFDHDAWDASTTLIPDPRLLFRFSALTFNTHRIHYDTPYARNVERYRGLVVHGPLIASLLMQLAADTYGDNALASFTFRAVSPAICSEPLTLALKQLGDGIELGSFTSDGRQTLKATATIR